ncbi:MAG: serine/threonine-protein phosphatase, partial [Hydrogenophaga sp.]|nr:serine/threonine-protein phosphatase [Hydrogenophaga sp.]
MAFQLDIGFVCQSGRKPTNEDFCAAMLPPAGQEDMGSIVAIADGVTTGGMGGEAAQTTVTSLVRSYHDTPETWDTTVALDRIIAAQNAWLGGVNRRRHPALGLTTLTALVLRGQSYTVAHVGDTRCYLLRDGQRQLITHDHVVDHPDMRNQLLRAVGLEDHLVVDYLQGDLEVGDTFVLLSDGVHGALPEQRLAACLAQAGQTAGGAQPAAERLVADALAAGSTDNLTAMVVRVLDLKGPNLQDADRAAQSLPVPHKLKVGEVIDGFSVTATAADNGINLLYQVRDPQSQTLYALKTLHPARANDPDERAMLAHEAWLGRRMMSSRAADHLVAVHHPLPNRHEPTACYVLYDWHGGETLQQQLDRQ